MIRVLIADSGPVERQKLADILRTDLEFVVVGEAVRAAVATEMAARLKPDVIVIGVRLPGGGLEATKEIMAEAPAPIVIVSDPREEGHVATALQALRVGALTVLSRPAFVAGSDTTQEVRRFVSTVRAMAQVRVVRRWRDPGSRPVPSTASTPIAQPPLGAASGSPKPADIRIVAIGASTGGPAALQRILGDLPPSFALPILIVQHISKGFLGGLVQWLGSACPLPVKTAEDGERLSPATVYIAPDDRHLGVSGTRIALSDAEPIGGFRPSATYLFESVTKAFGSASLHVILTGMGRDGVTGLEAAHSAGATVIAQDEASSVIFGMPGVAAAAGVVDHIVSLDSIAQEVASLAAPGFAAD